MLTARRSLLFPASRRCQSKSSKQSDSVFWQASGIPFLLIPRPYASWQLEMVSKPCCLQASPLRKELAWGHGEPCKAVQGNFGVLTEVEIQSCRPKNVKRVRPSVVKPLWNSVPGPLEPHVKLLPTLTSTHLTVALPCGHSQLSSRGLAFKTSEHHAR